MAAKTVKLSPTQQTVVNLMAQGWVLTYSPDRGRFSEAHASFRSADRKHEKVIPANLPDQLCKKGVVARVKDDEWRFWTYALTDEGRSLAGDETPVVAGETWYRISGTNVIAEEFARSTDNWLIAADGRKTAKHTSWCVYVSSPEVAIAKIRRQLQNELEQAHASVGRAERALAKFNAEHPAQ